MLIKYQELMVQRNFMLEHLQRFKKFQHCYIVHLIFITALKFYQVDIILDLE